jgi:hypothetical protein
MVVLGILPDETGSGNFKMAAAEPQVPIAQVTDKVATIFQEYSIFSWSGNSMVLSRILTDVNGRR